MILAVKAKARTKRRNHGDKENLADNFPTLDHSRGVFVVFLGLY